LAWTWPIISPVTDYVQEARRFAGLISSYAPPLARTLLHLGSGGGHVDYHLKNAFTITGVDPSPAMRVLAADLNPEATYINGDMRTYRSDDRFDVVVIADAIAYMQTENDLGAAFETAYLHLKPGGVLVTYAEETLAGFQHGLVRHFYGQLPDADITLIENLYDHDPGDTIYEATLIFLIRRGANLETIVDRHQLGLFSLDTWHAYLNMTGFSVHQVDMGRGNDRMPWFVGIRP